MDQKKKKKKIILDLDSTLVHCIFKRSLQRKEDLKLYEDLDLNPNFSGRFCKRILIDSSDKKPKGIGKMDEVLIIMRPGLREFMEFLTTNFDVDIWSAGYRRYVRMLEEIILPKNELNSRRIVFSREDCEIIESGKYVKVKKQLSCKNYDMKDVIIIDDREDVCTNNSRNSIRIPAYTPDFTEKEITRPDVSLYKIMEFLSSDEVKEEEDVRNLNLNIFYK